MAALDSVAVRQVVMAAEARVIDAVRRLDIRAMADLLEEDAILVMADGRSVRGRAAVQAVTAKYLRDMDAASVTDATREVLSRDDGVVVTSAATVHLARGAHDAHVRRFALTTVWRRQDDGALRISLAVDRGAPSSAR